LLTWAAFLADLGSPPRLPGLGPSRPLLAAGSRSAPPETAACAVNARELAEERAPRALLLEPPAPVHTSGQKPGRRQCVCGHTRAWRGDPGFQLWCHVD
jgi:hypothetical protein